MKKNLIFIAIIVVVGVGAFFGGMALGKNTAGKASASNLTRGNFQGINGTRTGQNASGGFVNGSILSNDGTSLTIKTTGGGSKIVLYSSSTEIGKFVTGGSSDLQVGQTVSVTGTANSDGSVTAKSIQIRPATQGTGAPGQNPPAQQ